MSLNMILRISLLFLLLNFGCGSTSIKDDKVHGIYAPTQERLEDGSVLEKFDVNQDGEPDVWKYFEEISSKEDPTVMRMILLKKEVDVNFDGKRNIARHYNEGEVKVEDVDIDLDGKFDIKNHFDNGVLAKKDLYNTEGEKTTTHFYNDKGLLQRVEKDTDKNDKVDYWEYYENGVLDRIGRDLNSDGRADTWQTR